MLGSFPCFSVIPDFITEGHFDPDYHGASAVNLAPEN